VKAPQSPLWPHACNQTANQQGVERQIVPRGTIHATKPKSQIAPRGTIARAAGVLLLVLLGASGAHAQADAALIKRVDEHYNHLKTLKARYSEHYTGLGADRTETGTLLLKKPGLMRWAYDQPPGKVFVLDGHYAWFYTPGDAQVSRTPAKQLDDLRSPLRFLLGHTQLAKELENLQTAPEGDNVRITGVPRGMENRVRLLTLVVSREGAIQRMKLEETDGATTEFTFTDQEENVTTKPSDFVFTPPAGLPVINAASPL
jgi:outer membrane lipoprotein carrier protein